MLVAVFWHGGSLRGDTPLRNALAAKMAEVDIWEEGLVPGDNLLLCCDGLWEAIRGDGIEEVLLTQFDPQAACDEMVRRANQAGGEDNISVIMVKVGAIEKSK